MTDVKVPILRPASLNNDFLSLSVHDRNTGDLVPWQIREQRVVGDDDPVSLEPGATLVAHFDVHRLFPLGLEAGEYSLEGSYRCPAERYPEKSQYVKDVEAVAAPITLVVIAGDADQKEEGVIYRSVLSASSEDVRISRATQGLQRFPDGLFARRLKIELAGALWRTKDRQRALALYEGVSSDPHVSVATRELCAFNVGRLRAEMGDLRGAIYAIRDIDSREARLARVVWQKDLNAQDADSP